MEVGSVHLDDSVVGGSLNLVLRRLLVPRHDLMPLCFGERVMFRLTPVPSGPRPVSFGRDYRIEGVVDRVYSVLVLRDKDYFGFGPLYGKASDQGGPVHSYSETKDKETTSVKSLQ